MAEQLMERFKSLAVKAFEHGEDTFIMSSRMFSIRWAHRNEFRVCAGNVEIIRIIGTPTNYRIVEV